MALTNIRSTNEGALILILGAVLFACGGGAPAGAALPTASPVTPTSASAPADTTRRAGDPYTISDLQALAKQSSYLELVAHLDDIRPTERDAQWQALAESGALGAVAQYVKDNDALRAAELAFALTKRYPVLLNSSTFRAKRTEIGLAGFAKCYAESAARACTDRMLGYVQADADNIDIADFAFDAGKLAAQRDTPLAALPFFRRTISGPKARERCDDSVLMRSMFAGIDHQDPSAAHKDGKTIQDACRALRHP